MSNTSVYPDEVSASICAEQANQRFNDTTVGQMFTKLQVSWNSRGLEEPCNHINVCVKIRPKPFHGQRLRCCHIGCRKEGKDFLYCGTCKMPFTNLYEHNHLEASSPSTSGGDDAAEFLSWSMISMELSPSEVRSVMKMWSNRTFQDETAKETPRSAIDRWSTVRKQAVIRRLRELEFRPEHHGR